MEKEKYLINRGNILYEYVDTVDSLFNFLFISFTYNENQLRKFRNDNRNLL